MHFCHATAAQPQKQPGKQSQSNLPDISELSPHLQQQWHPDNNALLGGIKVKPKSQIRVMWTCPNCPAGCPHIWSIRVAARTAGTKCPYCQGRKLCKHNSLATKAPTVARYWDHDKNAKTPEQTLAGSHSRADWKCPDCRYEWQAEVATGFNIIQGAHAAASVTRNTLSSQHLGRANTCCCKSGTMSAMPSMAYLLTTPR